MFEFIETCSENGPVSVKLCHLSKLIGWNKRQEQSTSKVSGLNDHTVYTHIFSAPNLRCALNQ